MRIFICREALAWVHSQLNELNCYDDDPYVDGALVVVAEDIEEARRISGEQIIEEFEQFWRAKKQKSPMNPEVLRSLKSQLNNSDNSIHGDYAYVLIASYKVIGATPGVVLTAYHDG